MKQAVNRPCVITHRPGNGTWFSVAPCSEAATYFSPFFANFSANTSQPHGCSQPAKLLPQNCTALREVHFIHTPVPCPGTQGHLRGHRHTGICPHKHPLQTSLPLHSLYRPSWFEKSVGGGPCSSSPPWHPQHSVHREVSWEHQHRTCKAAAETSTDVL